MRDPLYLTEGVGIATICTAILNVGHYKESIFEFANTILMINPFFTVFALIQQHFFG